MTDFVKVGDCVADFSVSSAKSVHNHAVLEHEASFSLNLFPDGYSIGKPTEGMLFPLFQYVPKLLHPYDKESKTLFHAIECGCLPGEILDDIPCKFFNGIVVCEVWDHRNCMTKLGSADPSSHIKFPRVQKVCLKMGMENVIKDMSSMSNDSWTYRDLLEVESRILKAMQPELSLDPKPSLDQLYGSPYLEKLDLGIYGRRQKRKQYDSLAIDNLQDNLSPKSNSLYGLRDRASMFSQNSAGNEFARGILHSVQSQPNLQITSCSASVPATAIVSSNIVPAPEKYLSGSCINNTSQALASTTTPIGKRSRRPESEVTSKSIDKRMKQETVDSDQHQLSTCQSNASLGTELCQRGIHLKEQQLEVRDNQSPFQQEWILKLQAQQTSQRIQRNIKKELNPLAENNKVGYSIGIVSDKSNMQQINLQRNSLFSSSHLSPQMQQKNPCLPNAKDTKKKRSSQRKNVLQNAQVPVGPTCSMSPTTTCIEQPTEKISTLSIPPYSSPQGSQVLPSKLKSNSLTEPSGKSDMSVGENSLFTQLSSRSPLADNPPAQPSLGTSGDSAVLGRLLRIVTIVQSNGKKNKVKECHRQSSLPDCLQLPSITLFKTGDTEEFTLPCYQLDRNDNTCRTRILTFIRPMCIYERSDGKQFAVLETRNKLVLSEENDDGTVNAWMIFDDKEISVYLGTLCNKHYSDLFASQFISLMRRDGFRLTDEQFIPPPSIVTCDDRPTTQFDFPNYARPSIHGSPSLVRNTNPTTNTSTTRPCLPLLQQNPCMMTQHQHQAIDDSDMISLNQLSGFQKLLMEGMPSHVDASVLDTLRIAHDRGRALMSSIAGVNANGPMTGQLVPQLQCINNAVSRTGSPFMANMNHRGTNRRTVKEQRRVALQ
ncbi:hypothetical protein QJS04_geneDACA017604 [Acorus gramineus]|uniref:Uncharacterized protein n=1 Tax=Acorus gramineus TaxID=55184 RepID=A0AAV9AWF9_ACOGR|nr:hypothetical protein QJS04_geneDACA017604 [Acorus gramineus]